MTRTVVGREAKAHFSDHLRASERGESIVITRHGKPVAALVSARDLPELVRLRAAGPAAASSPWPAAGGVGHPRQRVRDVVRSRRAARPGSGRWDTSSTPTPSPRSSSRVRVLGTSSGWLRFHVRCSTAARCPSVSCSGARSARPAANAISATSTPGAASRHVSALRYRQRSRVRPYRRRSRETRPPARRRRSTDRSHGLQHGIAVVTGNVAPLRTHPGLEIERILPRSASSWSAEGTSGTVRTT